MIHPNELRIDNLVLNDGKIHFINPDDIHDLSEYYGKPRARFVNELKSIYEPIPITEECLLKFGCEKYNEGRFMLKLSETLIIFWNIGDDYFICEFSSRSTHVCYFNDHRYVHQLQNLYFALTQKELTLKDA